MRIVTPSTNMITVRNISKPCTWHVGSDVFSKTGNIQADIPKKGHHHFVNATVKNHRVLVTWSNIPKYYMTDDILWDSLDCIHTKYSSPEQTMKVGQPHTHNCKVIRFKIATQTLFIDILTAFEWMMAFNTCVRTQIRLHVLSSCCSSLWAVVYTTGSGHSRPPLEHRLWTLSSSETCPDAVRIHTTKWMDSLWVALSSSRVDALVTYEKRYT